MALHEELAELRAEVGSHVFEDPATFRAAFDDFVPEGSASTGEVSLLVGAIATGALQRLLEQLALGADPATSIAAQGDLLARDRGTSESDGARWALSVLAHALGAVPDAMVLTRPSVPDSLDAPARPAPTGPVAEPVAEPGPTQPVSGPTQVVSTEPPEPAAPPAPAGRRGTHPLLIGAVVVLAVVAATALALLFLRDSDDPEPTAEDNTSPSRNEEVLAQLDMEEAGKTVRLQLVRDGTDASVVLLAERDGEYVEVDRDGTSCPFLDTSYDAGLEPETGLEFYIGWQDKGNESHGEYGRVEIDEDMVIVYGVGDAPCPSEN
ncbi:hypothetical protein [Nocardioides antri]|uniref:Uncharacterized protein n=1 Tax=Nocardioides antri TaxID=2607659 RepID=A0A5B1M2D9_9ACTN|nr:hypothetical protein [Nocardioides antri]KAA1427355.1 hypothetical protein F0U47_07680 [Nocardioides antri]